MILLHIFLIGSEVTVVFLCCSLGERGCLQSLMEFSHSVASLGSQTTGTSLLCQGSHRNFSEKMTILTQCPGEALWGAAALAQMSNSPRRCEWTSQQRLSGGCGFEPQTRILKLWLFLKWTRKTSVCRTCFVSVQLGFVMRLGHAPEIPKVGWFVDVAIFFLD